MVDRAIEDLAYHTKLLQALGGDEANKIVLHIGGVYGDKVKAMERFAFNYNRLDQSVRYAYKKLDYIYIHLVISIKLLVT